MQITHGDGAEKCESDERWLPQSRGGVVGVIGADDFIEAFHFLLKLRAQSTSDEITEGQRAAEQKNGACLDQTVGLPERRQSNFSCVHGMQSASVYSGSSGP